MPWKWLGLLKKKMIKMYWILACTESFSRRHYLHYPLTLLTVFACDPQGTDTAVILPAGQTSSRILAGLHVTGVRTWLYIITTGSVPQEAQWTTIHNQLFQPKKKQLIYNLYTAINLQLYSSHNMLTICACKEKDYLQ